MMAIFLEKVGLVEPNLLFYWTRDMEDASDAPFTQWELGFEDE